MPCAIAAAAQSSVQHGGSRTIDTDYRYTICVCPDSKTWEERRDCVQDCSDTVAKRGLRCQDRKSSIVDFMDRSTSSVHSRQTVRRGLSVPSGDCYGQSNSWACPLSSHCRSLACDAMGGDALRCRTTLEMHPDGAGALLLSRSAWLNTVVSVSGTLYVGTIATEVLAAGPPQDEDTGHRSRL